MLKGHFQLISEYLHLAKPRRLVFILNFGTAILYKALDILRPFIAALIIKALTDQNAHESYLYLSVFIGVNLLYRAARFFNRRAYSFSVREIYHSLQKRIFHKLTTVDEDFLKKISRGRLMNTINTDSGAIGEMSDKIAEYFTTILQIIAVLLISYQYSPLITTLMLISIILYALVYDYTNKKYNFYWWKTQTEDDRYSNFLSQTLSGLQEVRAFHILPKLHKKLSRIQSRYDRAYKRQRHYANIYNVYLEAAYYIFQSLIYLLLIYLVFKGRFAIDIFVLLISYHTNLINYAKTFCGSVAEIRLINASVIRVKSILNYKNRKQIDFGDLALNHLSGTLTLENVSLKLNKQTLLKDLNLKLKPNEFTVIVGPPGAGKTLLFDLLLRLKKPTKGKILLDNININEFSRSVYTSNVAVVNQSPFIFNMSIRNNLNLVDTDIKHQIEACKIAGIHNFIETLPNGYNTILRENATNISGGQKQMISIARTILTDAEVLLFDDITTSLDPDTAKLVPKFIKRLDRERTVIMITKKPYLMKLADRIIVLDQGKISDIGTHEKLLKRSSIYRRLQGGDYA